MQNNMARRGILTAPRAETSAEISAMVGSMNTAFEGFQARHRAETERLSAAVDELSVQVAAGQMQGTAMPTLPPELGADPLRPFAGARLAAAAAPNKPLHRIRAHYEAKHAEDFKNHGQERGVFGDFLRTLAGAAPQTSAVRAALQEGVDTAGGYLIPTVAMPRVLAATTAASTCLNAGAQIVPTSAGGKHVQSVFANAPAAAWREELGAVVEGPVTLRGVQTRPRSLAFYVTCSREVLMDALDVEAALMAAFAQSLALAFDRAMLLGSGVGPEPLGIFNTPGVNIVPIGGANGAVLNSYDQLLSAAAPLVGADYAVPENFIMSPRSWLKLQGLKDTAGQPLQPPPVLAAAAQQYTSQIPNNLTTGTSNDTSLIFAGDFTQTAFVLRERFSVLRSEHIRGLTGEVAFIVHARVDVAVNRPGAFSVLTGVR